MRILAIDPGDVRIGLAISDPSATIAKPHSVIKHQSRSIDADKILQEAERIGAERIVVGIAFDQEGLVGPQARKALRLVDVLKFRSNIPIETWDETGSTEIASSRSRKKENIDARAAAIFLQEYLDAKRKT
ncbi:MAG: Holliday junction resolvase RuvX [Chloroflexi bacterium]|nr:Holliday junction resolvase RuvX [Chloroflexota bacterium]